MEDCVGSLLSGRCQYVTLVWFVLWMEQVGVGLLENLVDIVGANFADELATTT